MLAPSFLSYTPPRRLPHLAPSFLNVSRVAINAYKLILLGTFLSLPIFLTLRTLFPLSSSRYTNIAPAPTMAPRKKPEEKDPPVKKSTEKAAPKATEKDKPAAKATAEEAADLIVEYLREWCGEKE